MVRLPCDPQDRLRRLWLGLSRRADLEQNEGNLRKIRNKAHLEVTDLREDANVQHKTIKEDPARIEVQIHHHSALCLQRRQVPLSGYGMGARRRHLLPYQQRFQKV